MYPTDQMRVSVPVPAGGVPVPVRGARMHVAKVGSKAGERVHYMNSLASQPPFHNKTPNRG